MRARVVRSARAAHVPGLLARPYIDRAHVVEGGFGVANVGAYSVARRFAVAAAGLGY
jgi:hypothetical protein